MKLNFKWVKQKGQYQNGEDLFINRVRIGSYGWHSMMSKNEPSEYKTTHQYSGNCNLPEFVNSRIYESTPELIKAKIERMATNWFAVIEREDIEREAIDSTAKELPEHTESK